MSPECLSANQIKSNLFISYFPLRHNLMRLAGGLIEVYVLFLYSRVISKLALPPHADADINLEGFLLPVSNESYFHPLSPTFQRKIGSGSGVEREGKVGGRMAAISQSISQYFIKLSIRAF